MNFKRFRKTVSEFSGEFEFTEFSFASLSSEARIIIKRFFGPQQLAKAKVYRTDFSVDVHIPLIASGNISFPNPELLRSAKNGSFLSMSFEYGPGKSAVIVSFDHAVLKAEG